MAQERSNQDAKWGPQSYDLVPSSKGHAWTKQGDYIGEANRYKSINDRRAANGTLAWDTILLEEVFEALGERDIEKQIEELVQTAAVAVAIAEDLRAKLVERQVADVLKATA